MDFNSPPLMTLVQPEEGAGDGADSTAPLSRVKSVLRSSAQPEEGSDLSTPLPGAESIISSPVQPEEQKDPSAQLLGAKNSLQAPLQPAEEYDPSAPLPGVESISQSPMPERTLLAPILGIKSACSSTSHPTGPSRRLPALGAAHPAGNGSSINMTSVLGKTGNKRATNDNLLDWYAVPEHGGHDANRSLAGKMSFFTKTSPKPVFQVVYDAIGLVEEDLDFAKDVVSYYCSTKPELRANPFPAKDILFLITLTTIKEVKALGMSVEDEHTEVLMRVEEPVRQAANIAKLQTFSRADDGPVVLGDNCEALPGITQAEENLPDGFSEDTDISEKTTAGFAIDTWLEKLTIEKFMITQALACGAPDISGLAQKCQEAVDELKASSMFPTYGTDKRLHAYASDPEKSTKAAPSMRAYLPNVWVAGTKAIRPAPEYPRIPFSPIIYNPGDFPMLRPIQDLTSTQVQAAQRATAEAKEAEEESESVDEE